MNKIDWKAIIIFFALSLVFDVALARFAPPVSVNKDTSNTLPPLSVSSAPFIKYGGIGIGGISANTATFNRLGVGAQAAGVSPTTGKGDVVLAKGDIWAGQFCLPGTAAEPNINCISNWLDAFGISSGQVPNSLVRWKTTNGEVQSSALYDDGTALLVGKPSQIRKLEITGNSIINAPAGTSGLTLKPFIGRGTSGLYSTSTVLSIDANGKVVLARVDCK